MSKGMSAAGPITNVNAAAYALGVCPVCGCAGDEGSVASVMCLTPLGYLRPPHAARVDKAPAHVRVKWWGFFEETRDWTLSL